MKSFKFFLLAVFLCASAIAENQHKQPPEAPYTSIVLDHSYKTLTEAAKAAFKIAAPLSKEKEYGGVIMFLNGKYYITNPVTINSPTGIDFQINEYPGAKIVGAYHTHPWSIFVEKKGDTEMFSSQDMRTAFLMNVKSFIWSEEDKKIRVFIPGKSHIQMYYDRAGNFDGYYSYGTVIH